MAVLDIEQNRAEQKYSTRELILRVLWGCVTPLFRWSPRIFWGWRRFLLRCFGAKVGRGVHIFPSVRIFAPWSFSIGDHSSIGFDAQVYNLGAVSIGNRVTVSQRSHLCAGTHDFEDRTMPLHKPPIVVEDDVWVCADAFIGSGVTLHSGAVTAARSVVVRDVEAWQVVGGNPAKVLRKREMKS